jgi:hypothetical protein
MMKKLFKTSMIVLGFSILTASITVKANSCLDLVVKAEFAKVLVQASNTQVDDTLTAQCTDLIEGEWYYGYVNTTVNNGWISCDSNNNFNAASSITIGDASQAFSNAGYSIDLTGLDLNAYLDRGTLADWADQTSGNTTLGDSLRAMCSGISDPIPVPTTECAVNKAEFAKTVTQVFNITVDDTLTAQCADLNGHETEWYYGYVNTTISNGWMSCDPNNNFNAASSVTIGEASQAFSSAGYNPDLSGLDANSALDKTILVDWAEQAGADPALINDLTDTINKTCTPVDGGNGNPLPPAKFYEEVITVFDGYQSPFPDINMSTLEGMSAAELFRRNVIGGFPDGEFKGDTPVNRAQIAKIFVLTAELDIDLTLENNGQFIDVPEVDPQTNQKPWYTVFVMTLVNEGVLHGNPDGTLRPDNTVNIAEFLKMMTLNFNLETNLPHSYTDVPSNIWYEKYVGVAEKYNLFPENAKGLLNAAHQMSRNEVVTAIYQYLKNR